MKYFAKFWTLQYVESASYYLLGIILSPGSQQPPDILDNIIMNIWQPEEHPVKYEAVMWA